jgi:hypothetical protein
LHSATIVFPRFQREVISLGASHKSKYVLILAFE